MRTQREEVGKCPQLYSLHGNPRKTLDSPSISGRGSFLVSQPQLLLRLLQILLSPSGRGHGQWVCREQLWNSSKLQCKVRESNTDPLTHLTKPKQTEESPPLKENSNKVPISSSVSYSQRGWDRSLWRAENRSPTKEAQGRT